MYQGNNSNPYQILWDFNCITVNCISSFGYNYLSLELLAIRFFRNRYLAPEELLLYEVLFMRRTQNDDNLCGKHRWPQLICNVLFGIFIDLESSASFGDNPLIHTRPFGSGEALPYLE